MFVFLPNLHQCEFNLLYIKRDSAARSLGTVIQSYTCLLLLKQHLLHPARSSSSVTGWWDGGLSWTCSGFIRVQRVEPMTQNEPTGAEETSPLHSKFNFYLTAQLRQRFRATIILFQIVLLFHMLRTKYWTTGTKVATLWELLWK